MRHAVLLVEPGTCYGRLDLQADPHATRAAAIALADALPAQCRVVTSPLRRCADLAAALQSLRPDLQATHDARIAEMDFGDWEGRAWSDIPQTALDAWTADFAFHAPRGGENVAAFMARVASAWDALPQGATAWITHAGVIRAATLLAADLRQVNDAAQWPTQTIAYGSATVLALPG